MFLTASLSYNSGEGILFFKSLPNDKILDQFKLKAFADEKINATEKVKFCRGSVENSVGKGENAGNQHFLLFPQCFQKLSVLGLLSPDCVVES